MATETPTATAPKADMAIEEKISQLRELFADAPEVGKKALETVLSRLASDASGKPPPPVESAGRTGARLGKVSELTIIVPFTPGGAHRLRRRLGRLHRRLRVEDPRLPGHHRLRVGGWPGIRSPQAKDYLAKYQVTAEGWYVANDLTVAETRRLRRVGAAVDEFLDKIADE